MTPVALTPPLPGATPEQMAAAALAEARLAALMSLPDVNQANAATGLYGDSGTGKSSLCATAAEYCWTRYHKTTHYVAADLGGFGNKLLRLIRLGIVKVYNPANHIEPFETMEDLSLGYWPETINDTMTGIAEAAVPLVAPQVTSYTVYCHQGHAVRTVANKGSLTAFSVQCPTCKTMTDPRNWSKVEEVTTRSAESLQCGLTVFDSATALQDWAMSDMATRAAKNMDINPDGKDGNALTKTGARVNSGKYNFGTNQPAHYGFAQNRMPGWIKNSRTIPGIVVPPLFTFLELRATDDTGRGAMPIYGPKIAGSAKTSDVPAWLGNCLHIARELNDKGRMAHRIWLVNHIDPGGIAPHLAKTRAEPGSLPNFLEDQEGEPPFTRFSLGYFFDQLEQVLHKGSEQDALDFPDAPLFQPLPAESQVVSRKDLSGKDIATGPAQGRTLIAPPAGMAAPATAVVARPAVAQAPAAVATASVPRPAAVAPAVAKPATAAPAAQATAAPAQAQAAKPATTATLPTNPVGPSGPAAPKPAATAPAATAAPAVAKPATAAPAQAPPAKPAVVASAAPAPAPAVQPSQPAAQAPAVSAAPAATTVGQPTAAVRPPATPAVQNRPAGRPPAPPPGQKPK